MAELFGQLSQLLSTLGASIMVPVMLFIIAKILGAENKKSFQAALLCGAGLTGFNLVIKSYSSIITPVIKQMVENAGVNLPILDTGWQATAIIAYSTNIGLIFFGLAILLQIILFLVKWTDVFMAADLWNNYSFMCWGSMLYLLTDNVWLALLLMIVQNLYTLLFCEIGAKRWSTYYHYPMCALSAAHHMDTLPIAIIMNLILNKLGFNKIQINAESLQKKFGIFGDPMFIGLFIGSLFAMIGNYNQLNKLSSWGVIATSGVSTAAVMAVFPKVAGIFASAFTILTETVRKKAKTNGAIKNREWYLGANAALGYGETNTLVTGILLIPIMIIIAFILPGNKALPMIDLISIPYMVEMFIAMSNGNIAKSIVTGAIWFSIGLLTVSNVAPYFTQVAAQVNPDLVQGGIMIFSFAVLAHPLMALPFLGFLTQNPVIIGSIIILYFIMYFIVKKYKVSIVDFIENMAK